MYYRKQKAKRTSIVLNQSSEGESIEQKVERILNNKEPITDGAPIIHTERKDGVGAGYNIRTDRFEVAVEAMDKVSKSHIAKREGNVIKMEAKKEIGDQSIDGKSGKTESTE